MAKKTIVVGGFTKAQREKELEKVKKKYQKKGYKYQEYIDNGALKSTAIFEVDDSILKKEKSKQFITFGVILLFVAFIIYPSSGNTKVINKSEVKEKWPFTVDKVTLKCYKENDIEMPVVIIEDKTYGLTGFADNIHGQKDINALNKYWLENKEIKNTRVSISEISKISLSLCK